MLAHSERYREWAGTAGDRGDWEMQFTWEMLAHVCRLVAEEVAE